MKLTNREIWRAYPALAALSKVKMPWKVSLEIAKLVNKLSKPFEVLSGESDKLVEKYGEKDKKTKQSIVKQGSDGWANYNADLSTLLDEGWGEDIKFDQIALPEMIAGTCDKCHHNLDVTFLIEPAILIPLEEKFITIK